MRNKLLACAIVFVVAGCEDIGPILGDPVDLSYALCLGAPDTPTWFAFQDGDGAWQRVDASASGSFDFTLASGRGGIAMVTPGDQVFVVYATTEEFQANLPACNGSVRNVSGTVTGFGSSEAVRLQLGPAQDDVFGTTAPASFSLPGVDATASDLVAIRYQTSVSPSGVYEAFPSNVFIRRNVTGTNTPTVDFASTTEAGGTLQRLVGVTNLSVGEALSVESYVALNTTVAGIGLYEAPAALSSGTATAPFYGIPAARLQQSETQMIRVYAVKSTNTADEGRVVQAAFNTPVDMSLTFGPALGAVTVSGGARPSATYNVQAAYDKLFEAVFSQNTSSISREIDVVATSAYFGGASTVTLAVPNLTGVSGFTSTWQLVPGVAGTWSFLAADGDLSILNQSASSFQTAYRVAGFTP